MMFGTGQAIREEFSKVTPKLTEDLPKPFKLEGIQRIDETPVHKAIRIEYPPEQLQAVKENLEKAIGNVSIPNTEGVEAAIATFTQYISGMPKITEIYGKEIYEFRENSIVVSIPFTRVSTEEIPPVIPPVIFSVDEKMQKILAF